MKLLFLISALAIAADHPDFSGNWVINVEKSDFGGAPAPEKFTRKIEHREPSMVLTDAQSSPLGEDHAVRNYTTDGKEISYSWMGGDVKSSARWDGSKLVIVSKVNASGTDLVVNSVLTLSEDGKWLTESDKITAGGSEVAAFKLVLSKQ
jgi:hypothetical protein